MLYPANMKLVLAILPILLFANSASASCKARAGYTVKYDSHKHVCTYSKNNYGNWHMRKVRSGLGEIIFEAWVNSKNPARVSYASEYPYLSLRCTGGTPDLYIGFDKIVTSCGDLGVDYRIDKRKAAFASFIPSNDCKALFWPGDDLFDETVYYGDYDEYSFDTYIDEELSNAKRLYVQFSPTTESRIGLVFDITGIAKVQKEFRKYCPHPAPSSDGEE